MNQALYRNILVEWVDAILWKKSWAPSVAASQLFVIQTNKKTTFVMISANATSSHFKRNENNDNTWRRNLKNVEKRIMENCFGSSF